MRLQQPRQIRDKPTCVVTGSQGPGHKADVVERQAQRQDPLDYLNGAATTVKD
jgi:hypothetical protein